MNFGINVDSLQNLVKMGKKDIIKKLNEREKYVSKIVEYNFFVQNEIEVSEKLNALQSEKFLYPGAYRFLTIKKYDFVKICESNKQILEKMNIHVDLSKNANNKKIVLLKYKKDVNIGIDLNNDKMTSFVDYFFYHNHVNNTSLFIEKPRASFIFCDFIHGYKTIIHDLLYLSNKDVIFLDFSSKNLLYNKKYSVFFNKFDKCLIRQHFNVAVTDLREGGDLQQLSKYIEIETYIGKFIKIIESIEYYGNKHFDLYFSKHLIKTRNFHIVYQNLDSILDDYLNNLYFLKNFSDKFKNDNKIKWKESIKRKIEENVRFFNIDVKNLNWKLYLLLLLENTNRTLWETFSLNSLFLNITYYMIKIFDIQDKLSVVHRYFKFLFTNTNIDCTRFTSNNNNNNNNNISISICLDNYDKYSDSLQDKKDFDNLAEFFCLSHVTIEQQEELYVFLLKNSVLF
jgi:urease accessory protein UreE